MSESTLQSQKSRSFIGRFTKGVKDVLAMGEADSPKAGFSLVPQHVVVGSGEDYHVYYVGDRQGTWIELISSMSPVSIDGIRAGIGERIFIPGHYADISVEGRPVEKETVESIQIRIYPGENIETVQNVSFSRIPGRTHLIPPLIMVDRIISLNPDEEITMTVGSIPDTDSAIVIEGAQSDICSISPEGMNIILRALKPGRTSFNVYPEGAPGQSENCEVIVREDCELIIDGDYDGDGNLTELAAEMRSPSDFEYRMGMMLDYRTGMADDCELVNDDPGAKTFRSNERVVIKQAPDKMARCRALYAKKKVSLKVGFLEFDRRRYNVKIVLRYLKDERWWRSYDVIHQ